MDNKVKNLEKKLYNFLSDIINNDLSNSNIDYIFIDRVELTNDKSYCTVFVNPKTTKKSLIALNNSVPFIKKQLSKNWTYRRLPAITFEISKSKSIDKVLDILDNLKDND